MSSADRKEREKKELMDLILMKAKEIIVNEGQEKLSIRKIANEIEYSPATIYLYFKDKDEILYQMMQKGFEMMSTYMEEIFRETSPVKRIFMTGNAYITFGTEHPDWYELMFTSHNPMNHIKRCEAEWGHGIAIFEFFTKTCEEAIKQQKLKGWEPRMLALYLWSSIHGLVALHNTQRLCVVDHIYESQGKLEMVEQLLETIMGNIFKYKNSEGLL
jgi:AcrR family transcriptional regulator